MWGIQPLVMTKLGGRPTKTVIGMALGIFLTSLVAFIFKRPSWTMFILIVSFIDGLALSYGLINQIKGFSILGVSKGTPISTGTQLIGAVLVGVIYFREWTTSKQYIIGTIALLAVILGVSMTTFQEKKTGNSVNTNTKKGVKTLVLSSLGFVAYTVILRLANIEIWDALIPQSLGMLLGSCILSKREDPSKLFVKESFKHIITGSFFGMGNITLMLSNVLNGLALGFTLTQMNVVIATVGGLIILKEEKTKKELLTVILGLFLVVLGGVLIGIIK